MKPSSSSSTWTSKTREIMAIEFLLDIPLEAEAVIVREGLEGDYKHRSSNRILLDISELGGERSFNDDLTGLEEDYSLVSPHTGDGRSSNRWWEKIVSKDQSYIKAENQRAEIRRMTLIETEILEAPNSHRSIFRQQHFEGPLHQADLLAKSATETHLGKSYSKDDEAINYYSKNTAQNLTHRLSLPFSVGSSHNFNFLPAPSRRLEGRLDVTNICIPREAGSQTELKTRHVVMARQATVREWEQRVLHGLLNTMDDLILPPSDALSSIIVSEEEKIADHSQKEVRGGLLDGRIFFSVQKSYPMQVFSVIKYEPEREEALRRRKKLEELGGGGMEYILPVRDWRGISYRELLSRRTDKKNKAFNRHLRESLAASRKLQRSSKSIRHGPDDDDMFLTGGSEKNVEEDDESMDHSITSNSSSDESTTYVPGFLDDPEMVQGKHRHVMVGDSVTGCVVSSTILFVRPSDLKEELNRQFRDRFDGWEPPKSQRKYIGAKIIDNVYTLIDPTEMVPDFVGSEQGDSYTRRRKMSMVDITLKIPPSLTLSKIRSVKQRALIACVREMHMEVSTVALACLYFERLCLDCRVDKSNRRISFAACLLLAAKINESNVALVHDPTQESSDKGIIQSWIRPTKKQHTTFLSLFDFFTREWSISLKNLFAAEWGVFSALQFSLHASPSQVAFHFKRLMKALEWSPINYLSREMYDQWQKTLLEEKIRKEERHERREYRRKQKEVKLLNLQRELSTSNRRKFSDQSYESPSFTGHHDVNDAKNIPASCILPNDSMNSPRNEMRHNHRSNIKPSPTFPANHGVLSTANTSPTIALIPRSQSQPLFPSYLVDMGTTLVDFDQDQSD